MKLKITLDGVTYEVDVEFVDEQGASTAPTIASAPAPSATPASTPQPQAAPKKPAAAPPASSGGDMTVISPLSGTVFKILVKVGDMVTTGQDLIILEAMKMETNIVAAAPGTIKNIPVSEGETVSQGRPLIEFE